MFFFRNKKKKEKTDSGVGFGGKARKDEKQRKGAREKAAVKENERITTQLHCFISFQNSNEAPNAECVGTIQEVLRNHVEWSEKRTLYEGALECCRLIASKYPELLEGPADDQSLVKSLNEFAQFSKFVSEYDKSLYSEDEEAFFDLVAAVEFEMVSARRAFQPSIMHRCRALFLAAKPPVEPTVVDHGEEYRQALRPLCFDFVDDLPSHVYAQKPQSSTMSVRNLFQELSSYKTALPVEAGSSIFVRAMENRLDLLRACIMGPEGNGTPYRNGAFIFDIFLKDYPTKPPKIKLVTTGGGTVRFNPNLYADGKVCLSLLGTWFGPKWDAGESTLLQVLISIQSLIFVEDPYFNEPGYGPMRGTPKGILASTKYDAHIRHSTMAVAIRPFLTAPSLYPEFDGALQQHYRIKRDDLREQLLEWQGFDLLDQEQQRKLSVPCQDVHRQAQTHPSHDLVVLGLVCAIVTALVDRKSGWCTLWVLALFLQIRKGLKERTQQISATSTE